MRIKGDIGQLRTIREFVAQASSELNVDERVIPDLRLAVDEICTNVFVHGYDGQGGQVEVTVEPTEEGIEVKVRDWGRSFDPEAVPVPDLDRCLEQRPLGGLGLFLVRQLMDEVRFEFRGQQGNVVTMVKRLAGGGEE